LLEREEVSHKSRILHQGNLNRLLSTDRQQLSNVHNELNNDAQRKAAKRLQPEYRDRENANRRQRRSNQANDTQTEEAAEDEDLDHHQQQQQLLLLE